MLFDEPEVYAYLEEIRNRRTTVAEHERILKKERVFLLDKLPSDAEVQVEVHTLSEEERKCPVCGSEMKEIGKEIVRSLESIPARFVVHEDHYMTYACKNCTGKDTDPENTESTVRLPRQQLFSGCSGISYDAEICNGKSVIQDGTGFQPQRISAFPADYVQLDASLLGDLARTAL